MPKSKAVQPFWAGSSYNASAKDDRVIRPAILWNDGRTDKETEYLNTIIGKKIVEGSTSLAELAKLAEDMGAPALPSSGRQEYLQSVVNEIMFK